MKTEIKLVSSVARKSMAFALAMAITAISGGFVATSSAQAADDCQVTVIGGDVTALSGELTNGSSTVICVSGTFRFNGAVFPATRASLTIKGNPTAIFESGSELASNTLLVTEGGEGGTGIKDLRIENINFDGISGNGRAISAQNITVINSTFKNFSTDSYGAAIKADFSSSIEIENSVFSKNKALGDGYDGGAVYLQNGNLKVSNSTFTENYSTEYGGAIAIQHSSDVKSNVTIQDSIFSLNSTIGKGGAVWISGIEATINNSVFNKNSADGFQYSNPNPQDATWVDESYGGDGGAIYAEQKATITASTFDGNEALRLNNLGGRGGAIYLKECTLPGGNLGITDSTFNNNNAFDGGAIFAGSNCITKGNNLTFKGNEALNEGGAIFTHGGEVKFSTFLDNLAATPSLGNDTPGNSIYYGTFNSQQTNCSPELDLGANIFANSSAHPEIGIGGVLCTQKVTDIGSNIFSTQSEPDLISAGSLSFANASIFGKTVTEIFGSPTPPLADNGGSTKTIALTSGSPAIDFAASSGITPSAVAKDQRGYDRIGASDAGAYEFGAVAAVVTPPTQNSTPAPTASTASSATSATYTKTLAATGSSSSTWGLGALAGLITALGVASLRSAMRSREI